MGLSLISSHQVVGPGQQVYATTPAQYATVQRQGQRAQREHEIKTIAELDDEECYIKKNGQWGVAPIAKLTQEKYLEFVAHYGELLSQMSSEEFRTLANQSYIPSNLTAANTPFCEQARFLDSKAKSRMDWIEKSVEALRGLNVTLLEKISLDDDHVVFQSPFGKQEFWGTLVREKLPTRAELDRKESGVVAAERQRRDRYTDQVVRGKVGPSAPVEGFPEPSAPPLTGRRRGPLSNISASALNLFRGSKRVSPSSLDSISSAGDTSPALSSSSSSSSGSGVKLPPLGASADRQNRASSSRATDQGRRGPVFYQDQYYYADGRQNIARRDMFGREY